MIKLDKIYTRGGDQGQTSLGSHERVFKSDLRVETYGTVEEANAFIGLALTCSENQISTNILQTLRRIQQELFDVGADLCVLESKERKFRISDTLVTKLEKEIDQYNKDLEPLTSFILPGGTALSAYLHVARTVIRRAERHCVALNQNSYVNPVVIQYLNRLSDLLFVLSRYVNDLGKADILWSIPQKIS